MVILDSLSGQLPSTGPTRQRKRHHWVRADIRCLMCGRLLGRLLGTVRQRENGDRSVGPVAFIAYRPLNPVDQIVPFTADLRITCGACGGAGSLDELEPFSTYDEVLVGVDAALEKL